MSGSFQLLASPAFLFLFMVQAICSSHVCLEEEKNLPAALLLPNDTIVIPPADRVVRSSDCYKRQVERPAMSCNGRYSDNLHLKFQLDKNKESGSSGLYWKPSSTNDPQSANDLRERCVRAGWCVLDFPNKRPMERGETGADKIPRNRFGRDDAAQVFVEPLNDWKTGTTFAPAPRNTGDNFRNNCNIQKKQGTSQRELNRFLDDHLRSLNDQLRCLHCEELLTNFNNLNLPRICTSKNPSNLLFKNDQLEKCQLYKTSPTQQISKHFENGFQSVPAGNLMSDFNMMKPVKPLENCDRNGQCRSRALNNCLGSGDKVRNVNDEKYTGNSGSICGQNMIEGVQCQSVGATPWQQPSNCWPAMEDTSKRCPYNILILEPCDLERPNVCMCSSCPELASGQVCKERGFQPCVPLCRVQQTPDQNNIPLEIASSRPLWGPRFFPRPPCIPYNFNNNYNNRGDMFFAPPKCHCQFNSDTPHFGTNMLNPRQFPCNSIDLSRMSQSLNRLRRTIGDQMEAIPKDLLRLSTAMKRFLPFGTAVPGLTKGNGCPWPPFPLNTPMFGPNVRIQDPTPCLISPMIQPDFSPCCGFYERFPVPDDHFSPPVFVTTTLFLPD